MQSKQTNVIVCQSSQFSGIPAKQRHFEIENAQTTGGLVQQQTWQ
jgi:hypothetical protein